MSDTELLHKAINNAKNFENFQDVLMAVSLHPEWLTSIPEGRIWAILHQVILSGCVNNLEQLLALQKSNTHFRFTTNTRDNKTILDVASMRTDVPNMTKRVQQLVKLDEMLNYAKDCKWDRCYEIAKENPSFVNEKPPYRRFYLIHHMACGNATKEFERFKQIKDCKFALNLRADRKKINVIAREQGQPEFAAYMEKEYPSLLDKDDPSLDDLYKPSEEAIKHTVTINTLMEQKNMIKDLDQDLLGEPMKHKSRTEVMQHIHAIQSQREVEQKKESNATLKAQEDERTQILLDNLMCPLTLAYFIEPGKYHIITIKKELIKCLSDGTIDFLELKTLAVHEFYLVVAADGFTYECSAISKWFEKNDRSPMTNQQLPNKNLNPNNVVKLIMKALNPKA